MQTASLRSWPFASLGFLPQEELGAAPERLGELSNLIPAGDYREIPLQCIFHLPGEFVRESKKPDLLSTRRPPRDPVPGAAGGVL